MFDPQEGSADAREFNGCVGAVVAIICLLLMGAISLGYIHGSRDKTPELVYTPEP